MSFSNKKDAYSGYLLGPQWVLDTNSQSNNEAKDKAKKAAEFKLENIYPRRSIYRPPGLLARQPFTFVYLTLAIPYLLFAVPLYAVVLWAYQRAFVKQAPRWSLLDSVAVYHTRRTLLLWFIATHGGIRGFFHKNLTDAQRAWRQKWLATGAMPDEIAPFPLDALTGPLRIWARETGLLDDAAERSRQTSVPIWWNGRRAQNFRQPRALADERLLVYLTGGGYMMSSCHPGTPLGGLFAAVMDAFDKHAQRQHLPYSAVTVEYRKSEQTATPAALVDCIALWHYVTEELHFDPQNITLLGDSAGGHIVNSLVRYLQDAQRSLPGSTIVICPWTDQAGTLIEHPASSYQRNEPYDVLSDEFYHTCRDTFAMHFKRPAETLTDVYFSPCALLGHVMKNGQRIEPEEEHLIFAHWPPTFIVAFDRDILLDQTTMMLRRLVLAKRAEGYTTNGSKDKTKLIESQVGFTLADGPHDPFVAPPFVFAQARQAALQQVTDWLINVNKK